MKTIKSFYLILTGLALMMTVSGCFETEFNFQTIVHPDGSVYRETKIDGRGGNLFKPPTGPGWEVKSWETKGGKTILFNTYYHVLAQGHFRSNEVIPPDYQYDFDKTAKDWQESDYERLKEEGITPPFDETLYSRNDINIKTVKGWFTTTYIFEETFRNQGIIKLLISDLKEEVRTDRETEGVVLSEEELNQLTLEKLQDEYLKPIQFKSEVLLPGKIVSTNAHRREPGKAIWEFSLKDFENRFAVYSLKARSQSIRVSGLLLCIMIAIISFAGVVFALIGFRKYQGRDKVKGGKKKSSK